MPKETPKVTNTSENPLTKLRECRKGEGGGEVVATALEGAVAGLGRVMDVVLDSTALTAVPPSPMEGWDCVLSLAGSLLPWPVEGALSSDASVRYPR